MEMETKLKFSHTSVLLGECMDGLHIQPDGIYLDGTLGGGGHSFEIVKRLKKGRLIAFDQDAYAIAASQQRLADYLDKIIFVKDNFCNVTKVLRQLEISGIDGALLDLGVSSYQLDTPERGFSYQQDAPLDMRMNAENPLSAYDVVNTYSADQLKKILYDYGEERFAPSIASAIVKTREQAPIQTTAQLVDLIKAVIPAKARKEGPHPAKRTFQAIRIEVNQELAVIAPALQSLVKALRPDGRLAVITFHSLEDRIAKQTFANLARGCECPSDFPVCVCGKQPLIDTITKKPILPSAEEIKNNPRSRSAKLRIVQKRKATERNDKE